MEEIKFEENNEELSNRVRAILGVPEEILTDDIISSPVFKLRATKYINKKINSYITDVTEEISEEDIDKDLLEIAYIYYICYLLCTGMDARLPKQMENTSTKTILQTISWDEKALEMLQTCDDTLDSVMEDVIGETDLGFTLAVLTDESEYPNTTI